MDHFLLFIIGCIAGLSGSIVGLGGGFIMIPFMTFLYHWSPSQIAGTSMAVLFANSISSSITYLRQKKIDLKSGFSFSMAMIPGSIAGAYLSSHITLKTFHIVFGFFLILISLFMLFKPKTPVKKFFPATVTRTFIDQSGTSYTYSFHLGFGLFISFLTGFLSSLLGIGGGSLMVPTMVLLLFFPPHVATATSMFVIMLSASVGTLSHALLEHILWSKVLFLAPGAFLGGFLGAKIAAKLPAKTILRLLAGTLIIVAIRLIFK